jgi:hypothetical protein
MLADTCAFAAGPLPRITANIPKANPQDVRRKKSRFTNTMPPENGAPSSLFQPAFS